MSDYIIQAEDMQLDDFKVVSGSNASGGELVKITDGDGALSTTFGGEAGVYDFTISVQDENDGVSTIDVVINGVVVGTITLDNDNDGGGSNNGGFSDITLSGLEIPEGAEIELRAYKGGSEFVRIDKIGLTKTGEIGNSRVDLLCETFGDDWDDVVSSDFYASGGGAQTNGNNDGELLFREVDLSGLVNGRITLDAKVVNGGFEEWGTQYGDMLRIEIIDQDGNVHLLDQFTGSGNSLTGSETGQTIDPGYDGLSYDIPAGLTSAQLRITSDISACGEKLRFDNVKITAEEPAAPPAPACDVEAADDTLTVMESEGAGDTETLDTGETSILANDTENDGPYAGGVVEVNGQAGNVGAWIDLAEGGRVMINADGTIDFDADGDFDGLNAGDSAQVSLDYTITCQDAAAKTNLLFVIDTSGSTLGLNGLDEGVFDGVGAGDVNGDGRTDTVLDAQLLAVKSAIQDLLGKGVDPSTVTVGLVTFNNNGAIEGTFALDDPALIAAIEGIQGNPNGWTNYDDGLDKAIDWFNGRPGDGADNKVVFLSDGVPRDPDGTTIQDNSVYGPEVATLTNPGGIDADIEAIAVGNQAELSYLNDLDNTGGAERVTDAETLATTVAGAAQVGDSSTATVTITVLGEDEPPVCDVDARDDMFRIGEEEGISNANLILGTYADAMGGDDALLADQIDGVDATPGDLGTSISLTNIEIGGNYDGSGNAGSFTDPDGNAGAGTFQVTTEGGRTGTFTVDENGDFSFDMSPADADPPFNEGETDSFQLRYTVERVVTAASTETDVIDFDGLGTGDFVNTQFAGVTISAVRANGSGGNQAMIFDAANPTGGDNDLTQAAQGNVLIISEDGDQSDPDDNAGGGTFTFEFAEPRTVESLTFLDTEEPTPELRFFDAAGNLIASMNGPVTSDGGISADFPINVANVSRMEVELAGSGAIDDLTLTRDVEEVTCTDTAIVTVVIDGEGNPNLLPVAEDNIYVTDENTDVVGANVITDQGPPIGDDGTPEGPVDMLGDGTLAEHSVVSYTVQTATGPQTVSVDPSGTTSITVRSDAGREGTLLVDAAGNLEFRPLDGFDDLNNGQKDTVNVSYTLEDANGDQSTADVVIEVNGISDTLVVKGTVAGPGGGAAEQTIVVLVDATFGSTSNPQAFAVGDIDGDSFFNTVFDRSLQAIIDMADEIANGQGRPDQEITVIPFGDFAGTPVTHTAGEIAADGFDGFIGIAESVRIGGNKNDEAEIDFDSAFAAANGFVDNDPATDDQVILLASNADQNLDTDPGGDLAALLANANVEASLTVFENVTLLGADPVAGIQNVAAVFDSIDSDGLADVYTADPGLVSSILTEPGREVTADFDAVVDTPDAPASTAGVTIDSIDVVVDGVVMEDVAFTVVSGPNSVSIDDLVFTDVNLADAQVDVLVEYTDGDGNPQTETQVDVTDVNSDADTFQFNLMF